MGYTWRLVRRFCRGIKNDRWGRGERRMAHLLAVPQLTGQAKLSSVPGWSA